MTPLLLRFHTMLATTTLLLMTIAVILLTPSSLTIQTHCTISTTNTNSLPSVTTAAAVTTTTTTTTTTDAPPDPSLNSQRRRRMRGGESGGKGSSDHTTATTTTTTLPKHHPRIISKSDPESRANDGHSFVVHPNTLRIVDGDGREVYFHGTNKFMGREPTIDRFSPSEMRKMADLGFNVIRLAINWHGFEPVRGQYNMTYVNLVHRIVQELDRLDMYVLIDAHQDCLNAKFCGDGIPDWAANPRDNAAQFPFPVDQPYTINNETGHPNREDCQKHYWGLYCLSEAGASAIQNFYEDYRGALTSFENWWRFMARELRNYGNILGYELLNEPFAGDVYMKPSLLKPSVANNDNLLPMYHRVSRAIREADKDTLIFFEPVTWSIFGSGFHSVPGGELYQNKSILSYHYYVPPGTLLDHYLPMRLDDGKQLNCGGMLTEFDVIERDDKNLKLVRETIEACYRYHVSWIGWTYTEFMENEQVTTLVSQPYAIKVAGLVMEQMFDITGTKHYVLKYRPCVTCKLPTVIFLSKDIHFPRGYQVEVAPQNMVKWREVKRSTIEVMAAPDISENDVISIKVVPLASPSNSPSVK